MISDEAYEDVVFGGDEHVSIASLPGMYAKTIPVYTFSKTYAMTGLRLAYLAVADEKLRERVRKVLFYTVSNTSSLIQYGGIGALEGSQDVVDAFRDELARPPGSVLQRHSGRRGRDPHRPTTRRRVLRVSQDRPGLAVAARQTLRHHCPGRWRSS